VLDDVHGDVINPAEEISREDLLRPAVGDDPPVL